MNTPPDTLRDVTVIVLAGGRATRLAALRSPLPKAMLPIGGQPYIGYLAAHYLRCGVASVRVAAGHMGEAIAEYFRGEPWLGSGVVVDISEPQGTGHDLVRAARAVRTDWVLLVMGDIVADFDPLALVAAVKAQPAYCNLVVCDRSPQNEGALEVRADGLLLSSAEGGPDAIGFPGIARTRKSSTGAALIDRTALTAMDLKPGASMEKDLFPPWISAGRMRTFDIGDRFFWDFGTPERYRFIAERPDTVLRLYGPARPGTLVSVPDPLAASEGLALKDDR
ncbi:NTP transferase domain-containing protein [Micromonospora sp. AP08]|uniref:NTP transferase domain-containing protein n=1 Tax=Micromonospora sp. AP08 TaxID=2604467 RepID=UPI001652876C|nr:NTP transferase domain-containing protein [Micromonospora sp. AP08]